MVSKPDFLAQYVWHGAWIESTGTIQPNYKNQDVATSAPQYEEKYPTKIRFPHVEISWLNMCGALGLGLNQPVALERNHAINRPAHPQQTKIKSF